MTTPIESSAAAPPAETPKETREPSPVEENEAKGAVDPVTGEINWDCPCLGGMADGPCGPEFKEAFSCFVRSTEEPKGIECVEKFRNMQDCFKKHPDVYEQDEEGDEEEEEKQADATEEGTTVPRIEPTETKN